LSKKGYSNGDIAVKKVSDSSKGNKIAETGSLGGLGVTIGKPSGAGKDLGTPGSTGAAIA